jgi:low affinity Fe/Cu permease
MKEFFRHIAKVMSTAIGSPYAFVIAISLVLLWAALGPGFGYSDTWQLVINTSTTIVTFLVVFMIQNTQNRDSKALHLKLDELIRSVDAARNGLIDSEDLSDSELERLEGEFADIRKAAGPVPPASATPELAKAGDPRRRAVQRE